MKQRINILAKLLVEHALNERYHEEGDEVMYGTWDNFKNHSWPVRWGEDNTLFWSDGRGGIFEVTSRIREEFKDVLDIPFSHFEEILDAIDEGDGTWLYKYAEIADHLSSEETNAVEKLFDKYLPNWETIQRAGMVHRKTTNWKELHNELSKRGKL